MLPASPSLSNCARVQACEKSISILRASAHELSSSFHPENVSDLASRDPLLKLANGRPRRTISRSLVAPFISDRRLLFSPSRLRRKWVAFHPHRCGLLVTHVSPPWARRERSRSFPRSVLIYWPAPLSPPLNATTQNANDTFMNSHAIHDYETALRIFLFLSSPFPCVCRWGLVLPLRSPYR